MKTAIERNENVIANLLCSVIEYKILEKLDEAGMGKDKELDIRLTLSKGEYLKESPDGTMSQSPVSIYLVEQNHCNYDEDDCWLGTFDPIARSAWRTSVIPFVRERIRTVVRRYAKELVSK